MNSLPLNNKETLSRKYNYTLPLTEEDGRLLILHHNFRGYKGKFISEGQIPILSLRRILDGCEDYFLVYSKGRWNVVIRTVDGVVLYEPNQESPPEYAVELGQRVAKAYSSKFIVVCPKVSKFEYTNGYLCIDYLERELGNLISRF